MAAKPPLICHRFAWLGHGWALAFVLDRPTGLQVYVAGPGDVVDEREGVLQLAILSIDHVEEAIAVSVGRRLDGFSVLVFVIEQHQLVVAGEVPGIVRCVLIEPLHFARGGIDTYLPRGIEAVVVFRLAAVSGTRPTVPGRRVSRTDDNCVGLGIEARTLPRRAATLAPGFFLASG